MRNLYERFVWDNIRPYQAAAEKMIDIICVPGSSEVVALHDRQQQ